MKIELLKAPPVSGWALREELKMFTRNHHRAPLFSAQLEFDQNRIVVSTFWPGFVDVNVILNDEQIIYNEIFIFFWRKYFILPNQQINTFKQLWSVRPLNKYALWRKTFLLSRTILRVLMTSIMDVIRTPKTLLDAVFI